jgi:hypothetical protein
MATLKVNRGTTYTISVNYQRNGEAASLVGATVRFTMKDTEFDDDATDSSAEIEKDITDGNSSGEATITIEPSDTATLVPGTYYYDVKVEDTEGNIYKIDEGKVKLDGSPTNRLS